jgi:phosphoribosylaminoimidazole carboxylase (NCAIR synthetase)
MTAVEHQSASSLWFDVNIKEVKKLNNEYSANVGRKTVETIEFEEAETEKLEFVRKHMGLKQNREVIKVLICEKCDEIKLLEEKQRKRQIDEAKAMECLEKGEYKCPM